MVGSERKGGTVTNFASTSALTQDLLSNAGSHYSIETSSLPPNKNSDRWTRILKMVSYVDWISYYCAILHGTDPTPVNKIEKLKGLL
mgnify:CR=1 FL=1